MVGQVREQAGVEVHLPEVCPRLGGRPEVHPKQVPLPVAPRDWLLPAVACPRALEPETLPLPGVEWQPDAPAPRSADSIPVYRVARRVQSAERLQHHRPPRSFAEGGQGTALQAEVAQALLDGAK